MTIATYVLVGLLFGSTNAALAASVEDAAKKDGSVVVYGAGNVEDWQKINAAFEKKFSLSQSQSLFRGNWEKVRNRVMTEGAPAVYFVDGLQIDGINGWGVQGARLSKLY